MAFVIKHGLSFAALSEVSTLFFRKALEAIDDGYALAHNNSRLRNKMYLAIVDLVDHMRRASGAEQDDGYWTCEIPTMDDDEIRHAFTAVERLRAMRPQPPPLTHEQRLKEVEIVRGELNSKKRKIDAALAKLYRQY
jgi:hypothetical protein